MVTFRRAARPRCSTWSRWSPFPTLIRLVIAVAIGLVSLHACAHAQATVPDASKANTPAPADSVPLRDIADVLRTWLHMSVPTDVNTEVRPGLSLTLLPSIGYNPAYGAFIGASVALGGWLGDPATTNLSAGSAGASYSTTGQISVQFKSDFYTSANAWALKGDWRYLDTS
jgi:hypothetical protein